ncbi:urease accessory protein UreE [Stappia sp. GBMRC 2046]|uniref:Urease accessory protein UreE n=1 Tax=Stappia sediminis TaxID=2692190 RepID=A0A7X3LVB7_9HYPH|nr:urease accessory protein UreE [Stappia sediminis]MXN65801.1 urease accessory protein UreE [Stappia sediminis]
MIRATAIISHVHQTDDTITLDEHARFRRRIAMTSDNGIEFLLDLPEATLLRHGDGLKLDDGRIIEVRAVPEPLLEVRGSSPLHLLQLAWHLGNRHLEAQIEENRILIRRDHVIADMLEKLGATTAEVVEPFDPEGGAYAGGHGHGHSHHHGHGHDH